MPPGSPETGWSSLKRRRDSALLETSQGRRWSALARIRPAGSIYLERGEVSSSARSLEAAAHPFGGSV